MVRAYTFPCSRRRHHPARVLHYNNKDHPRLKTAKDLSCLTLCPKKLEMLCFRTIPTKHKNSQDRPSLTPPDSHPTMSTLYLRQHNSRSPWGSPLSTTTTRLRIKRPLSSSRFAWTGSATTTSAVTWKDRGLPYQQEMWNGASVAQERKRLLVQ